MVFLQMAFVYHYFGNSIKNLSSSLVCSNAVNYSTRWRAINALIRQLEFRYGQFARKKVGNCYTWEVAPYAYCPSAISSGGGAFFTLPLWYVLLFIMH